MAVLAAFLYSAWTKDYPVQKESPAKTSTMTSGSTEDGSFAPVPTQGQKSTTPVAAKHNIPTTVEQDNTTNLITVKTDVLQIGINPKGGSIAVAKLSKYPVSLSEKNVPVEILSNSSKNFYVAQSGLTNTTKRGGTSKIQFKADKTSYVLSPDAKTLTVTLVGSTPNKLQVTKQFTFTQGSYAVKVQYQIKNTTGKSWSGSLYTQLTRKKPGAPSHLFYTRTYDGASMSSPDTPYQKVDYKDMDKKPIQKESDGGWVAMQQHYFLSAWVPESQKQLNSFYTHVSSSDIYTIGFMGPVLAIAAGQTQITSATLYVGPELAKNLDALAPGLERTIDYGWLWWFSVVIFWVMSLVHSAVGNWGWAIVITTIVIKFILYPLSATSFRSMARMRELQPKMQRLKEQYGNDRQAMSRATMELYKKEKINPVGGCLPMLIQIPVFIALYFVIIEAVQLRQAPFIFWIHDLSTKDPYYVLPILMGLSMLLQQKLTPSSPDPTQAKVMMVIPVVFTFFFLNFPAGLTLYWFVNNCVQMLQQWWVNKNMDAHMAKKARKKKKAKTTNIFKK